jgi:hypothetical protein
MTLEEQVRDALDDLVTRVPPRAGLADTVLREARRRRTRVRLVAAGGTAVAVAAGTLFVIADPLALDGADLGAVDPAAGEPAADDPPPDQEAAGPVTVTVDVTQVDEGPPPEVPWYAAGVLHLGEQAIPFDDDIGGFRSIQEVAGGLAVLTAPLVEDSEDSDHDRFELLLLAPGGGRTELGRGAIYDVAVSADGSRIAWAEHDWTTSTPDAGPGRTLLRVADARTGEVLHEREQTGADGSMGIVKGFLSDGRVLLDNATNAPGGSALWDPAAGTVTSWGGDGYTQAVSPAGDLIVVAPAGDVEDRPPAVVDAAGSEVWRLTGDDYAGPNAFSPDGGLLAVVAAPGLIRGEELSDAMMAGGEDPNADVERSVVVLDARTGEPVLTVEGTEPSTLVWESAQSFVFEAWNQDETAMRLVRCSLDGQCEQAAPEKDLSPDEAAYLGWNA